MSEPNWQPDKDNPLPVADTTVAVTVAPELEPNGGVRITYELEDPAIRFRLPSPGPNGTTPVSHTPSRIVEDHKNLKTGSASITRRLTIESQAKPARTKLSVIVADVVDGQAVRSNRSSDQISFFVI
jgi:hypothetical protein